MLSESLPLVGLSNEQCQTLLDGREGEVLTPNHFLCPPSWIIDDLHAWLIFWEGLTAGATCWPRGPGHGTRWPQARLWFPPTSRQNLCSPSPIHTLYPTAFKMGYSLRSCSPRRWSLRPRGGSTRAGRPADSRPFICVIDFWLRSPAKTTALKRPADSKMNGNADQRTWLAPLISWRQYI